MIRIDFTELRHEVLIVATITVLLFMVASYIAIIDNPSYQSPTI